MTQRLKRGIIIILVIIGLIVLLRFFGIADYFSFAYLKKSSHHLKSLLNTYYWNSVVVFVGTYALLVAGGFPSVAPLSLLGGFLYGLLPGTLYSVIAGTLGSLITFIIIRYLFGSYLQYRYKDRLEKFNEQIHDHGANYLLLLHFLSVVPFFVINSLAALTPVSFWTFFWTSVIGCAPIAFIYCFAGLQLSSIKSVKDIFSPSIIIMLFLLVLLSLLPILIKRYRRRIAKSDEDALL